MNWPWVRLVLAVLLVLIGAANLLLGPNRVLGYVVMGVALVLAAFQAGYILRHQASWR